MTRSIPSAKKGRTYCTESSGCLAWAFPKPALLFRQKLKSSLLAMEYTLKEPMRKWCCCKHIPEKCHRKILYDCSEPYGRQLSNWHSSHDYIEKNRSDKAHSGTHDGDCSRLPHNLTKIWVIFLRITVAIRKSRTNTISP